MFHLFLTAALASLGAGGEAPLTAGTQLNYRGTIESRAEQPGDPRKAFELTLWILEANESGAQIAWLIDERGRGEFPWSERFGSLSIDAAWRAAADGPAVLYDRGEGQSIVPIPLPFLTADKPLAPGADFGAGKLEFHVERATTHAELPAWRIAARDAYGPKQTLWVDQKRPLVLGMNEKVIMGRGEEYQLKLELLSTEQLDRDQTAALAKAVEKLSTLRGKLNLPPRAEEAQWNDDQLAVLRGQLPTVSEATAGTALARLATTAQRDLALQAGRSDAVNEMGAKFQGRTVDAFTLKGAAGESLSRGDLDGKVTVLHFWDYRDEPLKEPYGQVGYLDFMYHRRKDAGVQVYGIAVDGRLVEDTTRAAAERGVRKLRSFMNLSYPVLFDTAGLIKQFGDPRLLGANLPLFVVVGRDGKIVHYHVGNYEVHQDQGLKQLDEAIARALAAANP